MDGLEGEEFREANKNYQIPKWEEPPQEEEEK
jgi:hypothetical protein